MTKIFTKSKIILKRLWGKSVYICAYITKNIRKEFSSPRHHKKSHLVNFITTLAKQWRFASLCLGGFIIIYYGLGATISSSLNNSLHKNISLRTPAARHINTALSYVLKSQIDDTAWTPALPLFFPAAILDNLPNFQLGVKDSATLLIKRLAQHHHNKALKEATSLLEYSPDIWLFSQTENDKLAPGSAKQYRKALTRLAEADTTKYNYTKSPHELTLILKELEKIIQKRLSKLHTHAQEYNTEFLDIKADDIFYYTQGVVYTLYYTLSALGKDYQQLIVETEQYENLTIALQYLSDAETLNPLSIKNAPLKDSYEANHLIYLGYYLSRTENLIQTIRHQIERRLENNAHDD